MAAGIPMAIILLFSTALLFSVATAASLPDPPAPPPEKSHSVEECVKLLFDPPPEAPSFWKSILCRDLLRMTVRSFQITGNLSPEYLTALKELPRFKNRPAELKIFLCRLGPANKAAEAAEKFGCNKVVTEPIV